MTAFRAVVAAQTIFSVLQKTLEAHTRQILGILLDYPPKLLLPAGRAIDAIHWPTTTFPVAVVGTAVGVIVFVALRG